MITLDTIIGVGSGISHALDQLSLALFTTTAPSGSFAFILLAIYLLFAKIDDQARQRLDHYLVIPIAVALVGLIASTNHLGKPANSLYVLTGVGRSPLSNEVLASVVFAGCAWIRWLLGYSSRPMKRFKSLLLVVAAIAGAVQIWFTSFAYSISTVVSWNLAFTQVNQILAAVMGGSMLAACTLAATKDAHSRLFEKGLVVTATAACAAAIVSQVLQYLKLEMLSSGLLLSVASIAPFYPACIAVSAVIAFGSIAPCALSLRKNDLITRRSGIASCVLMLGAIFVIRFGFYALYTTVGI
jgi:anaerobic dimethyl sulfoxide reductase subunit C (anchor subunit)